MSSAFSSLAFWFSKLSEQWKKIFATPPRYQYITCYGKKDGIGAQAQAVFSTMLFAQAFDLTYVHTPFSAIEHNYDQDDQWVEKWEAFLGLGLDEVPSSEAKKLITDTITLENPVSLTSQPRTLYVSPHCHAFADQQPDLYEPLLPRFRAKFYQSCQQQLAANNQRDLNPPEAAQFTIAIHVRRGDVKSDNPEGRHTENQYYYQVLARLIPYLEKQGLQPKIQLYSQGEITDFGELQEFAIDYSLDECPFSTFYQLATADILIMSKSSFSYSAALLSEGIVFYEPFWHQPLSRWIIVDRDAENTQDSQSDNAFTVNWNQSQLEPLMAAHLAKKNQPHSSTTEILDKPRS